MSQFTHVDHVLVAEFDIDKGSVLRHQYPHPTGTPEQVLAELMLPDGAHLREEDWTVFFLNQTTPGEHDAPILSRQRRIKDEYLLSKILLHASGFYYDGRGWRTMAPQQQTVVICLEDNTVSIWDDGCTQKLVDINERNAEYREIEPLCLCLFVDGHTFAIRFTTEDDEILLLNHLDSKLQLYKRFNRQTRLPPSPPLDDQDKNPLMYVQNLVCMKQVAGARRGAKVKALAIASRHQWTHVFKPLLVLALERYFESENVDILAELYESINAMDLSSMPRLSMTERSILRSSDDKGMFEEKFIEMEDRSFYHNGLASAGTINTSTSNKDRHYYETKVEFARVRVPLRVPLAVFPEEVGDFSIIKLVTTFSNPDAVNPPNHSSTLLWKNGSPFYWHPHLDSGPMTHPVILLMNALLTQKRIIFLGHQRPAGEVADYVLAACALGSGGGSVLRGFAERCFPYVSLAGIDNLLAVPGFIAGVTNPMFIEQTTWWDVLCDINTGRIYVSDRLDISLGGNVVDDATVSKDRDKDWMRSGYWEGDSDFIGDIVTGIQGHMGELFIRQKCYDHIRRFVDVTAAYEMESVGTTGIGLTAINTGNGDLGVGAFFVDENAKRREMAMLKNRMEGWRSSRSYLHYQKDFQTYIRRRPIKEFDLRHVIHALRYANLLEDSTVVQMFLTLQDHLMNGSDAALIELLSLLPQSLGGLFPIATASEKEAYLYDPEFMDMMADSNMQGGFDRREEEREQKRTEVKKKAERRSMMFDAKNASRLIFTQNAPPIPQMPSVNSLKNSDAASDRTRTPDGQPGLKKRVQLRQSFRQSYRQSVAISEDSDEDVKPVKNTRGPIKQGSVDDISDPKAWPGINDDGDSNERYGNSGKMGQSFQGQPKPNQMQYQQPKQPQQQQAPQRNVPPSPNMRIESPQVGFSGGVPQGRSPPKGNNVMAGGGQSSPRGPPGPGLSYEGGPRGTSLNNPGTKTQQQQVPPSPIQSQRMNIGPQGGSPMNNIKTSNMQPSSGGGPLSPTGSSLVSAGNRDTAASDIVKRMIAQQEAKAQAMKTRLSEIAQRDSFRSQSSAGATIPGAELKNITMEPWAHMQSSNHIRWGSLEAGAAGGAGGEGGYERSSPQLQSPPPGRLGKGAGSPRVGGSQSPLGMQSRNNTYNQHQYQQQQQQQQQQGGYAASPKNSVKVTGGGPNARQPNQIPPLGSGGGGYHQHQYQQQRGQQVDDFMDMYGEDDDDDDDDFR
ncbi:hypothetical protein HDV05_003665 [Chytridiales sp. JEL 0842]|nr:hypothetical protein HDV05_003665 [Chytridiales sp. JEL 0842]